MGCVRDFRELRDAAALPELSAIAHELGELGDKFKEGMEWITVELHGEKRK
jgi:hypothetical protein